MGQFVGADPDQLDALGQQMGAAADRLESIRQQIGFWLDSSPWDGTDADEFRGDWHHRLQNLLHTAATVARDGASSVHRNAQQQRVASDTDGSSKAGEGGLLGTLDGVSKIVGYSLTGAAVPYLFRELKIDHGLAKVLEDLRESGPELRKLADFKGFLTASKEGVVRDLGKFASGFRDADTALVKPFGDMLPAVSIAADVGAATLVFRPGHDAKTSEKVQAGGDLILDVAATATTVVPPVSLAVDVVHVGFDMSMYYVENRNAINHAVETAATHVGRAVTDLDLGAAGAVNSLVSGGVHALHDLF